jgi:hypothetical protein
MVPPVLLQCSNLSQCIDAFVVSQQLLIKCDFEFFFYLCTAAPEEVFRPPQKDRKGGVLGVGSAWEDTPLLVAVSEWLGKLSLVVVASSRCALSLLLNEQPSRRRQWGICWISLYYEQGKSDCIVLFLATTHPTSSSSTARLTYIHRITGTVRAVCTRPA